MYIVYLSMFAVQVVPWGSRSACQSCKRYVVSSGLESYGGGGVIL